jgi:hypothetical protein
MPMPYVPRKPTSKREALAKISQAGLNNPLHNLLKVLEREELGAARIDSISRPRPTLHRHPATRSQNLVSSYCLPFIPPKSFFTLTHSESGVRRCDQHAPANQTLGLARHFDGATAQRSSGFELFRSTGTASPIGGRIWRRALGGVHDSLFRFRAYPIAPLERTIR